MDWARAKATRAEMRGKLVNSDEEDIDDGGSGVVAVASESRITDPDRYIYISSPEFGGTNKYCLLALITTCIFESREYVHVYRIVFVLFSVSNNNKAASS